jgi:hyperosmotically inducible protein
MKRLALPLFAFLLLVAGALVAADKLTDDQLYDQVRLRLTSDTTVQGGAIEVAVQEGTVTLKGRVRTEKAKEKATKVVKKIKGVKSVDNRLVIDNTTP